MTESTAEHHMSATAREILDAKDWDGEALLRLRTRGLTVKDVRNEIEVILSDLPAKSQELSGNPRAIGVKGLGYFAIGDNQRAVAWLSKAGRKHVILKMLGHAQIAAGQFEQAAETLAGIADEDTDSRAPLAEAYLRAGNAVEARKALKRITKSVRESTEGIYLQAYMDELSGEYEEAYAGYKNALELEPEHAKAMFRLAYMLDLDGNEDDAVELYEKIRGFKPTFTNALVNLGVLYEDRGEYTKALEVYQEILDIHPNHGRARRFLNDARASLNMYYDEDLERTEDRRAQILRIPISDFELSVRSRNCLAKMQIDSLGDLIKKTEQELLSYKNFGETSLQEIKDILAQKGLRLGMGREEQTASVQAAARTLLGIEPEKGDVLTKAIEDLELSVRSRNAMSSMDVTTIGDLTRLSEKDLMQVKNFGQTSMNEVKEKLAEFGLSLAESEEL